MGQSLASIAAAFPCSFFAHLVRLYWEVPARVGYGNKRPS